jgi:hypothetical protein
MADTAKCPDAACAHPLSCHTSPPAQAGKPADTIALYCARTGCGCILTAALTDKGNML